MDTAIRTVADEGPPISSGLFTEAVRTVDSKGAPDLDQALKIVLGNIPRDSSGYRQALLLCMSASDAKEDKERLRILNEASEVALDAVELMGEKYSASLTTPCTVVFGLGIMAPMILMSLLPMMGLGGVFGSLPIDGRSFLIVTLVLIPASILLLSSHIRSNNPFLLPTEGTESGQIGWILTLCIPLFILQQLYGRPVEESILLSLIPACVVCLMFMMDGRRHDSALRRTEDGLRDCVFEMGNALLGGENYEDAAVKAISNGAECSEAGLSLGRELDLCRGDVRSAIDRAIGPVSQEVSMTLCDIHRCSEKDLEDAGRLAAAMGRQFQNASNIRKELELRLKSMVDMMVGTAMFFAPMILGMSVSMLSPLSDITGYQGLGEAEGMLSVYLIELCAIISTLTSSLGRGEGVRGMLWRFCIMAPVALVVFRLATSFQL